MGHHCLLKKLRLESVVRKMCIQDKECQQAACFEMLTSSCLNAQPSLNLRVKAESCPKTAGDVKGQL